VRVAAAGIHHAVLAVEGDLVNADDVDDVDDVLSVLAHGADVYDEPDVDALSHALQCGAHLRAEYPDDYELAAAGLLHDISDIIDPSDHRDHDVRGAAIVAPIFGERVAHLVASHVLAKRFLVATEPAYRSQLSVRSVETLAAQGDALDELAIARLSHDPDLDAILALRRADEAAKDPAAEVPSLDSWRSLLEEVAE
jgi:predicted HD phosphohydrolase